MQQIILLSTQQRKNIKAVHNGSITRKDRLFYHSLCSLYDEYTSYLRGSKITYSELVEENEVRKIQ